MFLNPLWSVAILLGLAALYWFVIRPKLKVSFSETYLNIDNWFVRQWTRIVAFRSWVATLLAGLMVSLPDILANVAGIDFTGIIGESYAKLVATGLAVFLAINNALKTKPDGQKAP